MQKGRAKERLARVMRAVAHLPVEEVKRRLKLDPRPSIFVRISMSRVYLPLHVAIVPPRRTSFATAQLAVNKLGYVAA